jgi:hypothetical protein
MKNPGGFRNIPLSPRQSAGSGAWARPDESGNSTESDERSVVMSSCLVAEPFSVETLEAQMRSRLGSRVRDLRVMMDGDGVVLEGRAPSFHAKQLAQHAAMQLAGLPIIANDIVVG